MSKVTSADLATAAEWLDTYEGTDEDDPNTESIAKVIVWIEKEIEKRREDALMREYGIKRESARKALATLREAGKL